jgi:hypothetical protein
VCNTSLGDGEYLIMALPARFANTPYLHRFSPGGNIRDSLHQEDKSQIRTRSGPRIMEALRNLAICAPRLSGAPMSPKPPDGPTGPWTGHLVPSASHHHLETAVASPVPADQQRKNDKLDNEQEHGSC